MDPVQLLGSAAGCLTTAAFVPQVVKTWRTRSGGDLSYGMLLLFSTGLALWLAYGIAIQAAPIIVANSVTLLLALTVTVLKLRFERH